MYESLFLAILLFIGSVSATWTGIGVVGQLGHDGQVYIPDVGAFVKPDNFGVNKTYYDNGGTACHCKFYIGGGFDGQYQDYIIEADPRTDQSRLLTHMTEPREFPSITCVEDDTLIICGGKNRNGALYSCDICHISNPICVPMMRMSPTVLLHAAVYSNGRLYVIGGEVNSMGSSELLDCLLSTQSWTRRSSMSTVRSDGPGAVLLMSGHILVCGGRDGRNVLNSCESYDPLADRWSTRGSMHFNRQLFSLVRFEGRVYAIGGYDQDAGHDTVEVYDEYYDSWSLDAVRLMPDARYNVVGAIERQCVD